MNKSWIKILGTFTNFQDEKEHDTEIKKTIRKLIRRGELFYNRVPCLRTSQAIF